MFIVCQNSLAEDRKKKTINDMATVDDQKISK